MRLFVFLVISLLTGTHGIYAITKVFADDQVLEFIETSLLRQGTLHKDARGMVYLKIDNNYIHRLIDFIKSEGFEIPPYFGSGLHGAHITVIAAKETAEYQVGEIAEQVVHFKPKECQIVHPPTWPEGEVAYLITIEAPALDEVRQKYSLPKAKFDFHITIGIKQNRVA
jgi:hypothetical protein